jgi:dephospho-CoA kinase
MLSRHEKETTSLPCIGIVGGVGSGKSALARWVADHDPTIRVFNADEAGHRAITRPEVIRQLTESFGSGILMPDGSVDRRQLAALVFKSGVDGKTLRHELEAVVHPVIQQERDQLLEEWAAGGTVRAALIDAALLLEAGWKNHCAAVVFVDVPQSIREARVAVRGWTPEELARREASQWPLEKKREAADFVIDNSQTLDIAGRQLYEYIDQILRSRG